MAKAPTIHDWEWCTIFGRVVLRGEVDGRPVCALLHWSNRGYFGISRASRGTEEILQAGAPRGLLTRRDHVSSRGMLRPTRSD